MAKAESNAYSIARREEAYNSGYREERYMLWTLAVVLTVLWLLGLVSSYTMGGFIHLLLVLAIVVVLLQVIQGRRAT